MYIVLTERCNMKCDHCCMNAGPKGRDMKMKTFRAALAVAEKYGETITLGGGEPTLHPQFLKMLVLAMATASNIREGPLLIITNGKKTEIALVLAALAEAGAISADLSQDIYHEKIDPKVIKAFTRGDKDHIWIDNHDVDYRGIRNVTGNVINVGRATLMGVADRDNVCPCDDLVVDPDGNIFKCYHKLDQFGTVFTPMIPDKLNHYECSLHPEPQEDSEE